MSGHTQWQPLSSIRMLSSEQSHFPRYGGDIPNVDSGNRLRVPSDAARVPMSAAKHARWRPAWPLSRGPLAAAALVAETNAREHIAAQCEGMRRCAQTWSISLHASERSNRLRRGELPAHRLHLVPSGSTAVTRQGETWPACGGSTRDWRHCDISMLRLVCGMPFLVGFLSASLVCRDSSS